MGRGYRTAEFAMHQSWRARKPVRNGQSRSLALAISIILGLSGLAMAETAFAVERAVMLPAPSIDDIRPAGLQKAVLAGGCFWGVQGVFQHVRGVTSAV